MAGNKEGAKKRRLTIEAKYGKDAWSKWGKAGGATETDKLKGFAHTKKHNPKLFNEIRGKANHGKTKV